MVIICFIKSLIAEKKRSSMSSKSSSRSRSRSPRRERVDMFGRTISRKRVSRSRSRSRSRDRRYRDRPRRRSRSTSRNRSRSSSRYNAHNNGQRHSRSPPLRYNRTNIEDPEYLKARVFIGNLPADKVSKDELEELFKEYGAVLGMLDDGARNGSTF